VFSRAVRLDGPDGSWAGTARGVAGADGTTQLQYALTGEGAYEGLSALFAQDNSGWPTVRFDGWIFEGDLPTMPDPVEPPAELGAMEQAPMDADAAVAATEEPEVSGDDDAGATSDEGDEELSGTAVYIDGLRTWQTWEGEDTIYALEMSDPRANGTYTETDFVGDGYDSDSERPSVAALGRVTLVNDEGSWSGHESAVWDDEMGWRLTAWLAGEDAYEGLSLYLHAHRFPVYSTPEMEFDGVIFEGEPPVMLGAVEIPAE